MTKTIDDIKEDMEFLKDKSIRKYYLRNIIDNKNDKGFKDYSPITKIELTRLLIDTHIENQDVWSANYRFNKICNKIENKDKRNKIGETIADLALSEAESIMKSEEKNIYDNVKNMHEKAEQNYEIAEKIYAKIGNKEKADKIGITKVDCKLEEVFRIFGLRCGSSGDAKEYLDEKIAKYLRYGLSKKEAEEKFFSMALSIAEEIKESKGSIMTFLETYGRKEAEEFLQENYKSILTKPYLINKYFNRLDDKKQTETGIECLNTIIQEKQPLEEAEKFITQLPEKLMTEAIEVMARRYLQCSTHEGYNTHKTIEWLIEKECKNKELWQETLKFVKKEKNVGKEAICYENLGEQEQAREMWKYYAMYNLNKDRITSMKAFRKAGMDEEEINLRVAESYLKSPSSKDEAKEYFAKSGLSQEEITDRVRTVIENGKRNGRRNQYDAEFYEAFGFIEEARELYIELGKDNLRHNRKEYLDTGLGYLRKAELDDKAIENIIAENITPNSDCTTLWSINVFEFLESNGIELSRDAWIKLGTRAASDSTRFAATAFEKAGYAKGTKDEVNLLADLYEKSSKYQQAIDLRKKIAEVDKNGN